MSTQPRVLCAGETMALVAPTDAAPLRIGSPLTLHVGGAESNTAIALRSLGIDTAWASLLGSDSLGDLVEEFIRSRGVDTSLVERRGEPTGLYLKSVTDQGTKPLYYRSGSAASRMDADVARRWADRMHPELVHVTGITAQISAEGRDFLAAVCEGRVFGDALVSFDVNHRPALADAGTPDTLRRLARACDIVFVGADEAETVWGVSSDGIPDLLAGPRHLVVKDAGARAVEHAEGTRTERAALRVDVVEPVGAGDAFAGGWLAGLLSGADAGERLEAGHRSARRVLLSATDVPDDEPLTTEGARQ
ncbi:sugar kinase [Microbacterium ulmi]|uniref:Sugar kinase n=1 Tax=Microbacterium ulmi TaxID=179095 RepID=A0A7Y2Q230_9MICO|nr:sugar kinase [Microbacterium ulmi]NII70000.1 2-dehydro-3-deoxygluconokinase [Microbacterium ulmi]NNH04570.1 sugar kinase [Microbacterium ulmi]